MPEASLPIVTVLIPTYRRPQLLARAIASAVEQEGVEVRVRVFDNASGDGTAEVVAGFMERYPGVGYHCHAENVGAAANFEFAMRQVDTPYFSILSDDDYLLPGFYARAVGSLEREPAAVFWTGLTLTVDAAGTIWDARVQRWPREGLFTPPEGALAMTGGLSPTWTGIVFRRMAMEQSGLPDFAMQGPSDLDYLLRLACRHPYLMEKFPAAAYLLNADSYSETQPMSAFWPGWCRMIANAAAMPGVDEPMRRRLADALRADARRMLLRRGANALAAGRLDFARDAAGHLRDSSAPGGAILLSSLALACEWLPLAQSAVSWLYRRAERRIIAGRSSLQAAHGHLLRDA